MDIRRTLRRGEKNLDKSGTLSSALLLAAVCLTVLIHGAILPFTHENTYDAFIHMFFANSYAVSWFDHWEPRWYLGFSTISYPPGSHMLIAVISEVVPLRAAFVIVQIFALILLVTGVFRFALLWVSSAAAGYASLIVVSSTAIAETVHLFGQLPTILSLGIFLNGIPFVYRWIRDGGIKNFFISVLFAAGTTAAHHVTTLFGGIFFVVPSAMHALNSVFVIRSNSFATKTKYASKAIFRGVILAIFMIAMIIVTVYPYWYWSITDPITQVPIPHGSRENFLDRKDLGFIFFLVPWGPFLFLLPFVIFRSLFSNIWPLGLFILISFFLGLGGTTPMARALLRGAFDILTLDRFTFWSFILAAPIGGHLVFSLVHGRLKSLFITAFGQLFYRLTTGFIFLSFVIAAVGVAVLPTIKPTQPKFIDPAPIVQFLDEDNHSRWRYLTLGFGDQFAYLSSQTDALSVDGNYHSARRLQAFTQYSVERLENSKYMGVAGIGSLSQFLVNSEKYNLKYIFSNDEFYDPILHYTGWNRLIRLTNGVVVWEKPNISPIILPTSRNQISFEQAVAWGLIPPTALSLTLAFIALLFLKRTADLKISSDRLLIDSGSNLMPFKAKVWSLRLLLLLVFLAVCLFTAHVTKPKILSPEAIIEKYFTNIDNRDFRGAFSLLSTKSDLSFAEYMYRNKRVGGLYASYGKILTIRSKLLVDDTDVRHYRVEVEYLTSIKNDYMVKFITIIREDNEWKMLPFEMNDTKTPSDFLIEREHGWHVSAKRSSRFDADQELFLTRPKIEVTEASLVKHGSRYYALGRLFNSDIFPADVSIASSLYTNQNEFISSYHAGLTTVHKINPKQISPFRVDFEGTLSLQDYAKANSYDPSLYIPTIFENDPEQISVNVLSSAASGRNSSALSIQNARFSEEENQLLLTGTVVNSGTETFSLARVIVELGDEEGVLWIEANFLSENILPGKKQDFLVYLPLASQVRRVYRTTQAGLRVNGKLTSNRLPDRSATLSYGVGGYEFFSLTVDGVIYEAEF